MRRRQDDRRGSPRFEIVGQLWGTFETVLALPLRDLGPDGALLESRVPLAVDSIYALACEAEALGACTQVRVRHVERVAGPGGEQSYLIGVEFITRSPAMTEHIHRCMCENPAAEIPRT